MQSWRHGDAVGGMSYHIHTYPGTATSTAVAVIKLAGAYTWDEVRVAPG